MIEPLLMNQRGEPVRESYERRTRVITLAFTCLQDGCETSERTTLYAPTDRIHMTRDPVVFALTAAEIASAAATSATATVTPATDLFMQSPSHG